MGKLSYRAKVIGMDGRAILLSEWFKSIEGINAELLDPSYDLTGPTMRITKVPGARIRIPHVKMTDIIPDEDPLYWRTFQEVP